MQTLAKLTFSFSFFQSKKKFRVLFYFFVEKIVNFELTQLVYLKKRKKRKEKKVAP